MRIPRFTYLIVAAALWTGCAATPSVPQVDSKVFIFASPASQMQSFSVIAPSVGDQMYALFYGQTQKYDAFASRATLKVPLKLKPAMNYAAMQAAAQNTALSTYSMWIADYKQVVKRAEFNTVSTDFVGRFYIAAVLPNGGMGWAARIDVDMKLWTIQNVTVNRNVVGGWQPQRSQGFTRVIADAPDLTSGDESRELYAEFDSSGRFVREFREQNR